MKIGITLNEVLRSFIEQLAYTYNKYIDTFDLEKTPVSDFDLPKYFKFKDLDTYNEFLYSQASLEIFGHADQVDGKIMRMFNEFLMDIKDDGKHEVIIISREINKSIPATLFFLSKLSLQPDSIKFVSKYEDKWDYVDVLVTANPVALNNKPEGKISVKVNSVYNTKSKGDFEIDSILDFMEDEELRNKILNK